MNTKIVVKLQIEGLHRWENCNLDDVAFLKNTHRHIFFIEVQKSVTHDDRDIEIILFKRQIQEFLGHQPVNFEGKSCEMIAAEILNKFDCDLVCVLEDNENGACVSK